jgi:hypothetical protein
MDRNRERPLAGVRAGLHEIFAYHEVEDSISEELQTFVVLREPVLIGIGLVGQRVLKQAGVPEMMADAFLDVSGIRHSNTGEVKSVPRSSRSLVTQNGKNFLAEAQRRAQNIFRFKTKS